MDGADERLRGERTSGIWKVLSEKSCGCQRKVGMFIYAAVRINGRTGTQAMCWLRGGQSPHSGVLGASAYSRIHRHINPCELGVCVPHLRRHV